MDTENEEKEEKPKKGLQSKVFGFGGGIKNVKDKVRYEIGRNIKKAKEGIVKKKEQIIK